METVTSHEQILSQARRLRAPLLVYGASQSGKTSLAIAAALDFLRSGEDSSRLLLLSPTRASSALIRDAIESTWAQESTLGLTEQPSRSFASYAFGVLQQARRRGLISFTARAPRLLSGAEQNRIIGDILDRLQEEGTVLGWPAHLQAAAATEGFRKEVRELCDRAAELGMRAGYIDQLAQQHSNPVWQVCAKLLARYHQRLESEEYADAYDPAGLISAAADLLERAPEFLTQERQRLSKVIIDDLQEASPAVFRLLRLIGAGRSVLAFAHPDSSTQGFRGASPQNLRHWASPVPLQRLSPGDIPDPGSDVLITAGTAGKEVTRRANNGSMVPDARGGLPGELPEVAILDSGGMVHAEIAALTGRISARLPAVGPREFREALQHRALMASTATEPPAPAAVPTGLPERVGVYCAGDEFSAENAVLAQVLDFYDEQHITFSQIAVITRNGSHARAIARQLQAQDVPVRQAMSDVVLTEEPAVDHLLRLGRIALDQHLSATVEQPKSQRITEILELLAGRYGDTDALKTRRLRQLLRRVERRAAEADQREPRSSDELLGLILTDRADPVLSSAYQQAPLISRGLRRLVQMLNAGESYLESATAHSPQELLWALWESSGMSAPWAELSRGTSAEAERANRDLDALLALFQEANRFSEQNPLASVAAFFDHMSRLELPVDTLSETGNELDAVEVLTPAAAAGRSFAAVILYGLQDGQWPNLRPRGELLETGELVELLQGNPGAQTSYSAVKRTQVLADELRLFHAAASRAREYLRAICVDTAELRPSPFMQLITPVHQWHNIRRELPRPRTAAHLVAQLRRELESTILSADPADQRRAQEAGEALAELARQGIAAADPQHWWGLHALSSAEPALQPEDEAALYPSAIEKLLDQPLQWFTSAAGGEPARDFAREQGTLIHRIAEEHPQETSAEVLKARLAELWEELGLPDTWQSRITHRDAEHMLERLARYQLKTSNREVIGVEQRLQAQIPVDLETGSHSIAIRGTIDRIERDNDGALHVVDLKTGKNPPSAQQTQRHPQLGVYQVLLNASEFDAPIAEALLLYLGKGKTAAERSQKQVRAESHSWPMRQIQQAAQAMHATHFPARHSAEGQYSSCRVGALCPLCSDTQQVTQP